MRLEIESSFVRTRSRRYEITAHLVKSLRLRAVIHLADRNTFDGYRRDAEERISSAIFTPVDRRVQELGLYVLGCASDKFASEEFQTSNSRYDDVVVPS